VTDAECVAFLQWALPRLRLRWEGFRRVRRQVCKRLARRIAALHLADTHAYRAHLEAHPGEWAVLDGLCRISITRFHRDRAVFDRLRETIVPELAQAARRRGRPALTLWSAGCAGGEEPYTLAILWRMAVASGVPGLDCRIVATDADARALERAQRACYAPGTLRELPGAWRAAAFAEEGKRLCLRESFKQAVTFRCEDIRERQPEGPFDLVLCRNLVFTYFDEPLQRELGARIAASLVPGGWLIVGGHERLPEGLGLAGERACFRKADDP